MLHENEYLSDLFLITCIKQYSCRNAYDCKPDPAMAGLAIRLYEITIEGTDAAGNIGRDQCWVIIVPNNMMIQDVDSIVQKSSVRYPVAATTDLGIMLETKTNIILKYMYDLSQAQMKKIDAATNAAHDRGLMEYDEGGDPKMLHELNDNTPNNSNIKQGEKIEVELWMAVNAVGVVGIAGVGVGVGFGFVLGRIGRAG